MKELFEISECQQNGLKAAQIAPKHGKKEKFSIGDFCCEKVKNVTKLRMDQGCSQRLRRGRIWLEVGVAVEDSPRSRPAAALRAHSFHRFREVWA